MLWSLAWPLPRLRVCWWVNPEPQRRLSLRTRLPLVLLGVLGGLQLIQPDKTWAALWVGLAAYVGIAYLWAREMRDRVVISRSSQGQWVVAGDRLEETWLLHNHSILPVLWAVIRDHSDIPGYAIDRVVATESGGRYTWRSEGVCTQRGVFTLGPCTASLGDPFGLFEVTQHYPQTRNLLVYPRVMKLPEFELPQGRTGGRARRTRGAVAETLLPSHVRGYLPGDSLRLIHWRKTAQQNQLMVKQFDLEPAGPLWLALDLDAAVQAGADQASTLEYGVILAASLAAKHLYAGRAVGLIAFGRETCLVPPQSGPAHLWRLLHPLAHAAAGPDWPLARVLAQVGPDIGRGRTLLVITPAADATWPGELLRLQRRDIASAALLLDAASFHSQQTVAPALPALTALLADHGIPYQIIAKDYDFQPLIKITRRRRVLKTLSASGRVIAVDVEEEL